MTSPTQHAPPIVDPVRPRVRPLAIRRLHFQISAEDIAAGVRSACTSCPVALAIRRQGFPEARVSSMAIHLTRAQLRDLDDEGIPLPSVVYRWINLFDSGARMEPFGFELDVPAALRFAVDCT